MNIRGRILRAGFFCVTFSIFCIDALHAGKETSCGGALSKMTEGVLDALIDAQPDGIRTVFLASTEASTSKSLQGLLDGLKREQDFKFLNEKRLGVFFIFQVSGKESQLVRMMAPHAVLRASLRSFSEAELLKLLGNAKRKS